MPPEKSERERETMYVCVCVRGFESMYLSNPFVRQYMTFVTLTRV